MDGAMGRARAILGRRARAVGWIAALAPFASAGGELEWNERAAEHLLSRAAFGARPDEIARAVERGPEATVDALLAGAGPVAEPFWVEPLARPTGSELALLPPDERGRAIGDFRRADERQMLEFAGWWIEEMLDGGHPLRERLTLFWHGHFTSSYRTVRSSVAMIRQNELLREHALGDVGALLHGLVRDPALNVYLDNDANRRGDPNENLARELLELFTLGVGHYDERDVHETARALTGWARHGSELEFRGRRHDGGRKRILGRSGRFDADDLVELLLEQEACAEHLAGALLAWFEGVEPSPERRVRYAELLREEHYAVAPFLRRLFLDPDFYRSDVVGERVASPVDYLVGTCRRLGVRPPARLLALAAARLGERLFDPPNVAGWPGGESWITTSTYLGRGNVAGVLLGVLDVEQALAGGDADAAAVDEEAGMEPGDGPGASGMQGGMEPPVVMRAGLDREGRHLRRLLDAARRPRIHLTARLAARGARSDAELAAALCDELLAVRASDATLAAIAGLLAEERARLELGEGELLAAGGDAEPVLRRAAHVVLSAPEAHLH